MRERAGALVYLRDRALVGAFGRPGGDVGHPMAKGAWAQGTCARPGSSARISSLDLWLSAGNLPTIEAHMTRLNHRPCHFVATGSRVPLPTTRRPEAKPPIEPRSGVDPLVILSVCLVLLLGGAPVRPTFASTVMSLDLEQTVRLAGIAFAGTVRSTESTVVRGFGIVTYVTFNDLRIAKGQAPGQTITIAMSGGTVDSLTTFVIDQPTFTVGQRYIVLAYASLGSAADDYTPIVGLHQGFFPVKSSRSGGMLTTRDWEDREIVGVRDTHLVVVRNQAATNPGTVGPKKVGGSGDEAEFAKPRVDTRDPGTRERVRHAVPRVFSKVRPESIAPGRTGPNAQVAALNAQLLSENRVPIEIIGPESDPHSRMSEGEFLGALQRFAGSR